MKRKLLKYGLASMIVAALAGPVSANAWYEWATSNQRGSSTGRYSFIGEGDTFVSGIEVREQGGHGVVNARLLYNTSNREPYWGEWTTTNQRGQKLRANDNPSKSYKAYGIQVREQGGYGIINIRIIYRDSKYNLAYGKWSTNNFRGESHSAVCAGNTRLIGIQVREQGGYGIINARPFCR